MSNKGKTEEETTYNNIVGRNIKYLRKQNKFTQTDIGRAIGVSFQQVQKYENGINGLHSHNLKKIAHRCFNTSMDALSDPQMIIKHKGFSEVAPEWL